MATNLANNGTVTGRLGADPVAFTNDDGSKKVYMTVYSDRNYRAEHGTRPSDRISLETWVAASTEGLGVFDHVHQGGLVHVRVVQPGPARPLSYRIARKAIAFSTLAWFALAPSTIVGETIATGYLRLLTIQAGMVGMGTLGIVALSSLFWIVSSPEKPASEKVGSGTWRWFLLQDVGPDRRIVDAM